MTKDEAEKEALKQWRALPLAQRQTFEHAQAFARALFPVLQFETLGNRERIIEAWLLRELKPTVVIKAR